MKRPLLLPITALITLLVAVGCKTPVPVPQDNIEVQVKSNAADATLTMQGKAIGTVPQNIVVHTNADLMNLLAARGTEQAVEKRIRFINDKAVEVTFLFGDGASAMAKVLGLPKILVFDYGAGYAFDIGKSTLKPEFEPLLQRQSELLKTYFAGLDVYICGHTDSTGGADKNMALSLDRAQAVADDLGTLGAAKDKFKVQGFGSAYPVASNETTEGKALNRRTEVILPQ